MTSEYDRACRTSLTHECPDCLGEGVRLSVVRRSGRDTACCLRCGRTSGFVRRTTPYTLWHANPDSVPVEVANVFERKYGTPRIKREVPIDD